MNGCNSGVEQTAPPKTYVYIVGKARRISVFTVPDFNYGTPYNTRIVVLQIALAFFLFGLLDIPTVRTNALSCIMMMTNYIY